MSMTSVMTATAGPRRPPNRRSRRWSIGQVATTIITDQTKAGRNGRRIQNDEKASPARNITARVVRARSLRGSLMAVAPKPSAQYS